jgi:hypothetical protein
MNLNTEFQRQLQNLIDKNYPKLASISESDFIDLIMPLKKLLHTVKVETEIKEGYLPFVIVVKSFLVHADKSIENIIRNDKQAIEKLYPHQIDTFKPISTISLPNSNVYLLIDIDRGKETLNIAPIEALNIIEKQKRSPLTIDEGIAILTHYPQFLQKNNCFSLLGSRANDKRVPAFWLSENQPKLGWCWNGNPHTWLGSASCKTRLP